MKQVATYFRLALLLGLVRGDDVHAWARDLVAHGPEPSPELVDLLLVPEHDLSELRHALWPLCDDPVPPEVVHAVLGAIYADVVTGRRSWPDTVTVLDQLRSFERLPPDLQDAVGAQVHAHLLGTPGVGGSTADAETVTATWLQQFAAAAETVMTRGRSDA